MSGLHRLARREAQAAALVANGLPDKEIAKEMRLTLHTVHNYLNRVYEKLGISSRVELVLYMQVNSPEVRCSACGLCRKCCRCWLDQDNWLGRVSWPYSPS